MADLRSAVCKETCKTIALLSYKLKSNVATLLEFWWPKIFRLVTIKIQVMAKAADSCIRAILFTCHEGRLLQLVAEGCSAKNATLRKLTLDYLCIICATWKKDLLEK